MEADTERSSSNSTPNADRCLTPRPTQQEVELVFKPVQSHGGEEDLSSSQTRFIKTTTNATVEHLVKYLSMRHRLEANGSEVQESEEFTDPLFTLYLPTGPGQYQPLEAEKTLDQIWGSNVPHTNPLQLNYAYNPALQRAQEAQCGPMPGSPPP